MVDLRELRHIDKGNFTDSKHQKGAKKAIELMNKLKPVEELEGWTRDSAFTDRTVSNAQETVTSDKEEVKEQKNKNYGSTTKSVVNPGNAKSLNPRKIESLLDA